jgi:small neutral amino acid transporter SnatA (MarC family)
MGKIISVIGGAVAVVLGLFGVIKWFGAFLGVLKGTVPAMLIFGGLIALFLGISEIKDEKAAKQEEKK